MERIRQKTTNKKGFTLVELVIVIVIIGILSIISVSAYSSLALKAIEVEGATMLNFIVKNEVTYQIENGTFLDVPNLVNKADTLGVNLSSSKCFQSFQAILSTDDEGDEFVLVVLKGTSKGTDITMSIGRSASGYMTDILKGEDATNISLAKSICQQKRNRYRYGNNGNGNDNENGTGNGKGNNGNANGQDKDNENANNGKDNGGNGNNDKKDDPDDDKSQGQGSGNNKK